MNLDIKKNILLAPYTSLRIGGPAKYFFEAKDRNELIEAIKWSDSNKLPYFILGGGTNILVSDNGFPGLVVRIKNQESRIKNNKIYANAGVSLGKLIAESIKAGLTGLEWAVGLPGTLGGAIRGNAGSFGKSISNIAEKVGVLDKKSLKIKKFTNKDCKFGYRDSIFKKNHNLLILEAVLKLKKGDKEKISQEIKKNILYRSNNHPKYLSCGCIFKNSNIANLHKSGHKFHEYTNDLLEKFKGKKWFDKIPSGYLIEECGLKGKKIGGAEVSQKHANFILNKGGARAEDVIILISIIKQKVRNRFGILLEEEIQYVGF